MVLTPRIQNQEICLFFDIRQLPQLRYILLHEFGHVLSIGHPFDPTWQATNFEKGSPLAKEFFEILGVGRDIANRDAEGIEHHLNPKTIKKLRKFITFLKSNPKFLKAFSNP